MQLRFRAAGMCASAFFLWSATPVAGQTGNTIYACINGQGSARLVAANEQCKPNETRVAWNVVGPVGPAGPTGATGPQGPTGPQGSAGPQGVKGDTGAVGPQGSQGVKGDTGAVGPQGSQGVKGDTGAVGPQGSQGVNGDTGAVGPQGSQGVKGDTGAVGPQGSQGSQGVKGDTGAVGPQGSQGPQGAKGDTGATGPQGSQGSVGPQGAQGPQGEKGDAGTAGSQGQQGPAGAQGPQGDGFEYRGAFDANQTYGPYDVVVFGGSAYLAIAPTTGAPGTDPSWILLVSKGDTGATGATGSIGPIGPIGPQGPKGDTGGTGPQGAQGPAGSNGGSVSVAAAPAITCPAGGAAITDAFGHTQYVCDGKTGTQGPQGAPGPQGTAGSTLLVGETWINLSSYLTPFVGCCNTSYLNLAVVPSATLPLSTFERTTTGGKLLIEASLPFNLIQGPHLFCQPNIDGKWAGTPMGDTYYDYIHESVSSSELLTVVITRVYPAPPAGLHKFSLACGTNSLTSQHALITGGVVSFTVQELH